MYSTLKFAIVIGIITNAFTTAAQDYSLKAFDFRFGSEVSIKTQKLDAMFQNFEEATFKNQNFSGFRIDSLLDPFLLPIQFDIDACIGKREVGENWKDRLEYHIIVGVSERLVGYDNRIFDVFTPNADSEIEGKIYRDQYEFLWKSINPYAGLEFLHRGREKGRCIKQSFYFGPRLVLGAGVSRLFEHRLVGNYYGHVVDFGSVDSYVGYYKPAINYSTTTIISPNQLSFSLSYGVTAGFDWITGKRGRFKLGFNGRFGGFSLIDVKGKTATVPIVGFNYTMGMLIGNN